MARIGIELAEVKGTWAGGNKITGEKRVNGAGGGHWRRREQGHSGE